MVKQELNLLNNSDNWVECMRQWFVLSSSVLLTLYLVYAIKEMHKAQREWDFDQMVLGVELVRVSPCNSSSVSGRTCLLNDVHPHFDSVGSLQLRVPELCLCSYRGQLPRPSHVLQARSPNRQIVSMPRYDPSQCDVVLHRSRFRFPAGPLYHGLFPESGHRCKLQSRHAVELALDFTFSG